MAKKKPNVQIEYRKIADLEKLGGNPRYIKEDDMARLKQSINDNPDYFECRPIILSNRTGQLVIIAGNQRYEAAKLLGLEEVPTVLLEGLTENREKEIVIRDNVSNGRWDWDILANENWGSVEELGNWGVECSFIASDDTDLNLDALEGLNEEGFAKDASESLQQFVISFTFDVKDKALLDSYIKKHGKETIVEYIVSLCEQPDEETTENDSEE